jgi:hypothetical protein
VASFCAALLLALTTMNAQGQGSMATIEGRGVDSAGVALPGVTVTCHERLLMSNTISRRSAGGSTGHVLIPPDKHLKPVGGGHASFVARPVPLLKNPVGFRGSR